MKNMIDSFIIITQRLSNIERNITGVIENFQFDKIYLFT